MVFGTVEIILLVGIVVLLTILGLLLNWIIKDMRTAYTSSREYTIEYEITESPQDSGFTDLTPLINKKSKKTKKRK